MNRKVLISRATAYVIAAYALLAILLIGPLGLFDRVDRVSGNENPSGTTPVAEKDCRIQQVFIADGRYLEKIGIWAENDLSRRVVNLTVYDETGEICFSRNVALDTYEAPGFFVVPVEFQTTAGRAYVWQISRPEEPLVLGSQKTAESGLTIYGNYYYVDAQGQTREQVGENVPMRLYYAAPLSLKKKAALSSAVLLAAVLLQAAVTAAVRMAGRKGAGEKKVRVQWIFCMVCNPVIIVGLAAGLYAVNKAGFFGGQRADRMIYSAGMLVLATLLLLAVNQKREGIAPLFPMPGQWRAQQAADRLQSLFWAGTLWGCIDYVNAMYNIGQDCAYRKTLLFLGLVMLSMCPVKQLFSRISLAGLAAGCVLGGILLWLRPGQGEPDAVRLARLQAAAAVLAVWVLVQVILLVRSGKADIRKLSLPYSLLLGLFFLLLVLFRNTRGWPVYLAVVFTLLYFFYLCYERKEKFLGLLCDGIILNFACALVFAVLRRPYRAWGFYRYNFVFHTVTVTAAYLTVVICALFVKLLMRYHRSRRFCAWWGTGLLFGAALSLLIMTLSRTGYLAAAVMGAVMLFFVSFGCCRERVLPFLQKTGTLILLVLLCFPVTYSSVRLVPALYDDPYLFELEAVDEEWAVHKGDRPDSENYITFSRFAYCLDVKLFGDEHRVLRRVVDVFMTDASEGLWNADGQESMPALARMGELLADAGGQVPVSEESAPAAVQRDESEEDFSNGRLEIFRRYISQWNLTGHDEMGVELENGSLSVHAHNTYLQVIHDHGLLTGLAYLALGLVSLIQMIRYALLHLRKHPGTDPYAALPLAIFLAYAVAGLVEWLFHPCNPMGLCTCAVLAPLLTFKYRKEKNNEG